MEFDTPLIKGTLIKRYKRFLADVTLQNGDTVTAHTPNTGSMKGCCEPGSTVWLRDTANPDRKYPFSWEIVEADTGVLVGINTHLSNTLIKEAIDKGVIRELQGYDQIRSEVRYGNENSRIDLILTDANKPDCFVEIKNVTLAENGVALFPDAVTKRGSKHLRELQTMVEQGYRSVILFCVQRRDVDVFHPADEIDPDYGRLLREVIAAGVEAIAYKADVSPEGIAVTAPIPVNCP